MTQICFARGLLAATAISSFVVAGHASAQESGGVAGTAPASTGENVIIVTATKSGQSLEDTAAAISVLGADDVGAGGIEDAGDLVVHVSQRASVDFHHPGVQLLVLVVQRFEVLMK